MQVGQPVKHELLPVELALAFSLLAIPIAKIAIILLTPIIFLDFFLKKDVLVIIYSVAANKNVMLPNRTTRISKVSHLRILLHVLACKHRIKSIKKTHLISILIPSGLNRMPSRLMNLEREPSVASDFGVPTERRFCSISQRLSASCSASSTS